MQVEIIKGKDYKMENEELMINEDIEPTPEPFVIPLIYNYAADTKEFTGVVEQSDKDSAKSAQVGHFVPMVHANATLLEPPTVEENQIQVYSKTIETHEEPYEVIDPETGEKHTEYREEKRIVENWTVEPDYRQNFKKVDDKLNVYDITTIGEQTGYYLVDNSTAEEIKANSDYFEIVDSEIVKKSEDVIKQEQLAKSKAKKNTENTLKAKQAIENGFVVFKGAEFETNAQTVGDLTATILLMQQAGLETYNWLSRDDVIVELSVEDIGTLGQLIAQFKNAVWNGKYLEYKNAISKARTVAAVEKVVIDYENITNADN